ILSWDDCWRRAFVLPSEATLWRERPYELFDQSKGEWETGQFDRVVFRPDGSAEIYDFKTNRIFDGEPAEVFGQRMRKTYSAQMNAYRRALSRLCAIDESRISTTLLLTATGTSVKIES
ncbi:MAG: hypothetical protein IJP66_04340, partial [Kiritimatiellae bacterium]|nr:hypothetical protein [Kiritimatiellia bacterium]